jgi:signal transduction histidine kinase
MDDREPKDVCPTCGARPRLARELQDDAIGLLIAVEMQIDVIRRKAREQSSPIVSDLCRLQDLLREEVLKLRELMQQPVDVDSATLLQFLRDIVERFQRQTGIEARFVSELNELHMPQRICRELARIVQEGLIRFRRLAGTQHVAVGLTATDSHWQLTIEGDAPVQKDIPLVIRESVGLINGELTVDSTPSGGSRLVVIVPFTGSESL